MTDLYYYADDPPDTVAGIPLRSFWLSFPDFQYLYAPTLRHTHVYGQTVYLNVWLDRYVASGPDDPAEWLITTTGAPFTPLAITHATKRILLVDIKIAQGVTRLQYTPGTTPYLATDGGSLPALDIAVPYPY